MENRILEEDEYSDEREPRARVLDDSIIREPISTLEPQVPVCVAADATVADAIRTMQEHRIGCVLVTGAEGLAGIFTERDVLRHVVGAGLDPETTPVTDLMTPNPETVRADAGIVYALNKMSLGGFRHVPVVDDAGRPVGIISVKDVVDYIVDFFSHEVLNVPPEPGLDVAKSREGA